MVPRVTFFAWKVHHHNQTTPNATSFSFFFWLLDFFWLDWAFKLCCKGNRAKLAVAVSLNKNHSCCGKYFATYNNNICCFCLFAVDIKMLKRRRSKKPNIGSDMNGLSMKIADNFLMIIALKQRCSCLVINLTSLNKNPIGGNLINVCKNPCNQSIISMYSYNWIL